MKKSALAVLLYFFLPEGNAQDITFSDASKVLPIGKSVWLYEDKTGTVTLDDILQHPESHPFTKSASERPNFANTTSSIWCRFSVSNTTDVPCLLQIEKALIHYIDFYKSGDDGSYSARRVGALVPMSAREIRDNFFLFKLGAAHTTEPQTFYIRFSSEESLELPMSIAAEEVLFVEHRSEEIIFGIFYGLMLVTLIYNLFIFLIVRDRAYLYYVLYILSALLLNDMMICGLGFEFLWPEYPRVNFYINALTGLVGATVILFSSRFLNTAQYTPKLHKGFYIFYGISLLIIVMNVAGEYFYSSILSQLEIFIICLYLIATGFVLLRRGVKTVRFYMVGWGIFVVTAIIYVLFMNGLFQATHFIENAPLFGCSIEAILLSMALGDRINTLQREKQQAQIEKLELASRQNQMLEKMVTERTYEIAAQNEEIAAQNEELVTQQDHIQEQNSELQLRNKDLEDAKKVIEEQHSSLKKYSENLEEEISVRANDLLESNKELIAQNHQLEQFAFITAHNLRAPVARIQGLASIIRLTTPEEKEFIIQKIEESSQELDSVIRDLAKILEVRKGSDKNLEKVVMDDKLQRVLKLLREEVEKSKAIFLIDFKAAPSVFSLPQYIESILYNLISNAIKYKSPRRTPEITITTQPNGEYVRLTVSDNGLGLDLEKFNNKIFGLYQRFHLHIEGKGLGLYLVKTQVDALGGKIDIRSNLDSFTTFYIDLPFRK